MRIATIILILIFAQRVISLAAVLMPDNYIQGDVLVPTITFSGATDFTDNFRITRGVLDTSIGQTSVAGNGFVNHDRVGFDNNIFVYDTTPGDATVGTQPIFPQVDTKPHVGLSVSLDVSAGRGGGRGPGVVFFDAATPNNNVMVRIQVDEAG